MPFTERQLRDAFELFDADGSGFIEPEELSLVFKGLGYKMSIAEVQEIMSQMDKDPDSKIDFDEFKQVMDRQTEEAGGPSEVLAAFKAFDMSSTGEISKDDLRAVAASLCERVTDQDIEEIYNYCAENDKQRHGEKRFTFFAWRSVMEQVFYKGPKTPADPSRIQLPGHDDPVWDQLEKQERTDRKEREAELEDRRAYLEDRNEKAKQAKEAINLWKSSNSKPEPITIANREAKWRQMAEDQDIVKDRLARKKHVLVQQRREDAERRHKEREEEMNLLRKLEQKKEAGKARENAGETA
ncbi:Calcium-binding protein CML19 [Diplonema papillatum]|nr:Calcium-binding protein CML19 [Diplonema papillatum]